MHTASRSAATRTLVCVLAFALWLASTLGLMHRTLHGSPASHPAAAVSAAAAEAPEAARAGHAGRGLFSLFGDHTQADCRLYDQSANGPAALGVPMVILPVTLPAATFACFAGEALARWAALFDARGPPSAR